MPGAHRRQIASAGSTRLSPLIPPGNPQHLDGEGMPRQQGIQLVERPGSLGSMGHPQPVGEELLTCFDTRMQPDLPRFCRENETPTRVSPRVFGPRGVQQDGGIDEEWLHHVSALRMSSASYSRL